MEDQGDEVRGPSGSEPSTAPRARGRQNLALMIGAGLGLLVVAGVLYATLSAGGSSSDGTAGANATTTTTELPPELQDPIEVPDGDYTAFCKEVANLTTGLGPSPTSAELQTLLADADFDAILAVSPDGLKPSLETLRDDRQAVVDAFAQAQGGTLAAADFPEGFLRALLTVGRASQVKCPGLAPAGGD